MPDFDFTDLQSLLAEVGKYAIQAKEPTLFAVGGRGYYENPASDLLAFFLKPHGEHGLGDLFLSVFLECMGEHRRQLDTSHISVEREVITEDGKYIDLEILGTDWCLLIENKIYHWEANPFPSYEDYANGLGKKTKLYAILSPSGSSKKEGKREDWKGVSYEVYCQALRERMATTFFDSPFSKWHLFAREFILHIENELYNPPMKHDQADFVEKHAAAFNDAQKLLNEYPKFLLWILEQRLAKELKYKVEIAIWSWGAIGVKSPERWGNAWIALMAPTLGGEKKFYIGICPDEARDSELRRGRANESQKALLKGMRYKAENSCWTTEEEKGFENRDTAINDFILKIKLIESPAIS